MNSPKFKYSDVKYATDRAIFDRAVKLFESGRVGLVSDDFHGYSAIVQGSTPYRVSISASRIDDSSCTCYMGQKNQLCKHALALALAVLDQSGELSKNTKGAVPSDPDSAKECVNEAMKLIKPYRGPSRIWFRYQRDLSKGCGLIEDAVAGLPSTEENAKYLWSLVKRLDRKLGNGVDDSDGTVGGCVMSLIDQLVLYAKGDAALLSAISKFCAQETAYDFNLILEDRIDRMV
jgi:hypothetical protein